MLYRETQNLESVKYRIHRMQKDEKINENSAAGDHIGATLLEKIRAENVAATQQ